MVPLALLGLPSLHEAVEAIAKGFFEALAGALVPGFLKHATVSTIQHLVALPDPQGWPHVAALEAQMIYLGVALLPVSLAASTLRYWVTGLTGAAHPVSGLGRCVGAAGALVAYRWIVEQAIAAANTFTHAILGFHAVGNGLAAIVSVLFGGALLSGTASVFGALLVIVAVVFAASLFALQVLLTLLFALLCNLGPPLIALSPIPECEHLLRSWVRALATIALVPVGWTVLFATAGALSLDAASVEGGAGGLPGHIAAAFAGLATFALAVKLPLMLLGEARRVLASGGARVTGSGVQGREGAVSGAARARAARGRLRSALLMGAPAMTSSVGLAARAFGTPRGGLVGTAKSGLARAAGRRRVPAHAEAGETRAAMAGGNSTRDGSRASSGQHNDGRTPLTKSRNAARSGGAVPRVGGAGSGRPPERRPRDRQTAKRTPPAGGSRGENPRPGPAAPPKGRDRSSGTGKRPRPRVRPRPRRGRKP